MRFHYECGENGRDWRRAAGRGSSFRFGPFDFDFDFDDRGGTGGRGGWGGRRGRERKRMFEGGELRLVLLKLIADEPRHGYELIKAIEVMRELYAVGKQLAQSGYQWQKVPPGFENTRSAIATSPSK